jgi:hypothetical protein
MEPVNSPADATAVQTALSDYIATEAETFTSFIMSSLQNVSNQTLQALQEEANE